MINNDNENENNNNNINEEIMTMKKEEI